MKAYVLTPVLVVLGLPLSAAQCPSPNIVAQALKDGAVHFDVRGNRLDDDPIGMILSPVAQKYMDKASVGLNNKYPENVNAAWHAPAGMRSDPEWKMNITLKRGIFGDGSTYLGAEITYGGQVSCKYDFSDVSGFSQDFLKIEGVSAACVPANARNWKMQIPKNGKLNQPAAFCASGRASSCALACMSVN